ncbi:MAG: 50S ribosomal protein L24 [Firmicutes bacterium]|nr:50S ribosomal protein L24 [Bacillota bacterium]MBQ9826673.1 50S ribosomal protein L24 [Bacillota bacterium]
MKIRKNDTVLVITGKDKGKTGKVLKAFPKENRIIVEGVNIQSRHEKARQDQPAQIVKAEGPIDASNVMYYDTKAKQGVRIGYKFDNGHKVRISKKTGQVID